MTVALLTAVLLTQPGAGLELARAEEKAFAEAALVAAPSVVRIETVGGLDKLGEVMLNTGATTGTIIEPGLVLSSAFNFAGEPSAIFVTLADGQRVAAELVATDELRQLVLLRLIDAGQTTPIERVDRDALRVGQWSIAIGRTYDQSAPNVSVGLFSAKSRLWGLAMQTDAKVSPTNYGGPLVDLDGRAIGILVPLSPQASGETAGVEWYDSGIGFVIPIADAAESATRLLEGKDIKRGLVGIAVKGSGLVGEIAEVDRVQPNSPADRAGIKPGDVITAIGETPVDLVADFKRALAGRYAGETVAMSLRRDREGGESETLDVRITLVDELPEFEFPSIGVLLASDATVRRVETGAPADGSLKVGDRIESIGGNDTTSAAEAIDAISRTQVGEQTPVRISRDGAPVSITLTPVSLATTLPDTIKPPQITGKPDAADRGRVRGQATGSELSYTAYLPEVASERSPAGLLVWLGSGDPIAAYRSECETRNVALVLPAPSQAGGNFSEQDVDDLVAAISDIASKVPLDPSRVAVYVEGQSTPTAIALAASESSPVRGLILVNPNVRKQPPATDPARRLLWAFGGPAGRIRSKLEPFLTKQRHPVTTLPEEFAPADVLRFVDWMGRI